MTIKETTIKAIIITAEDEPSDFAHVVIRSGIGGDSQPYYLDIYEDATEDLAIYRLSKEETIERFSVTEEQLKELEK